MKECDDKEWGTCFQQLVEYKSTLGDCNNVTLECSRHPHLRDWLRDQLASYTKGTLKDERKDMLNRIGVVWSDSEIKWEFRFRQLLEYKKTKGDCNVPLKFKPNPQLGNWVMNQRQPRTRLLQERKDRLNSVGFVWNRRLVDWYIRFEQLVQYKRTHGNCNVPRNYELNKELGRWVSNQQNFKGKNALHKDRVAKLESIGFRFSTGQETKKIDGSGSRVQT